MENNAKQQNIITAAIFIKDRTGISSATPVENYAVDLDAGLGDLKEHLKTLQKGYCEGKGDRPRIGMKEIPSQKTPGKMIKTIYAESEADYFHIAYLGMKIKGWP